MFMEKNRNLIFCFCKRKTFFTFLALCIMFSAYSQKASKKTVEISDRQQWVDLCYQIAAPVLENMSKGELRKNMPIEVSPTWDNRTKEVTYLEAFGRLMAGISPWLVLDDDGTPESLQRQKLRTWALQSYKNAVNPESPDFLYWKGENQILVDAAYLVQSFLRAPALWQQLDTLTQKRYINILKEVQNISPAYNNWLLFGAMVKTFLIWVGEPADYFSLKIALWKIEEWYLGDGWYADGPELGLDYYNAYVMHPMYVEILEILENKRIAVPISSALALKRMQRFDIFIERLISPEGTYPAFGRSVVYRLATFQTLALSAWRNQLNPDLSNGQVRSAITAVMKNMFKVKENFGKEGFLQLGFVGHQPHLSNSYTNNGSLYMTSLVFMPLGLPANHAFWTDEAQPWTSQKAWKGEPFPIDNHRSLKNK